jgi:hypothetical protein
MRRTLVALTAASALAVGTTMAPTAANAFAFWIIPAIIGASIGGLAVGGAAGGNAQRSADEQAYNEARAQAGADAVPGNIYVRPSGEPRRCTVMRERTSYGSRRVEVCN